MEGSHNPQLLKIVTIGDQKVGKTSIINASIDNKFHDEYRGTLGVEFQTKNLTVNDNNVKLQLWSISGQKKFQSILSSYFKDARAVLIVVDLNNFDSINNIETWINMARQRASHAPKIAILGNKSDLDTMCKGAQFLKEKAEKLNLKYWIVSAKTGENIKSFFDQIVTQILA